MREVSAEIELTLIEVAARNPPAGQPPIIWRLLTTHRIASHEQVWRIVGWYRQRWAIEQLFGTLKSQGLRIEDSQVGDADRLVKLTAIAAHAACIVMQLVQARDGKTGQAGRHRLRARRDRRTDPPHSRTRRNNAGAEEPAPATLPCVGCVGDRQRLGAQRCVNPIGLPPGTRAKGHASSERR